MKKPLLIIRKLHHFIKNLSPLNEKPVIIVGNQKTGSTAIASLLATATGNTISQDFLYSLTPSGQELLFKKKIPFDLFLRRNKSHFSSKIIKELDLIFCIDQVLSYFPEGKFVCILRDPRDNIRSILNRLNLPGNLNHLSEVYLNALPNNVWREMLKGTIYGTEGKFYIETLSKRWHWIINQYEKYQSHITLLRYEDFVSDKKSCIHQIAEQMDLEVINDIHDFIDIQYQPKGNNNVSWEVFFGKQNLEVIEKICKSKMQDYGYWQ